LKRLLFILFGFTTSANAMLLAGNTVFSVDNTMLDNDDIYVTRSVVIENYATINTDMYVCSDCDVYIRNSGKFNANVHMSDGARIIQVVSNPDEVKSIDVNVAYSVVLDNVTDVNFSDVLDLSARGAKKLTVKNSKIVINENLPKVYVPLEIQGEVSFVMDNVDLVDNKVIVENVFGDGVVRVLVNNAGTMHTYDTYIRGGNLYLDVERETDYNKVFDSTNVDTKAENKVYENTGDFINGLRDDKNADKLLDSLDSAQNTEDLINIMQKSVRFNPNVLHEIPRAIHALDMVHLHDDANTGVNVRPWGIKGGNFWGYGADFGVTMENNDSFALSITGRVGHVEYDNDIDVFNAKLYGANLYAKYAFENNVVLDMSVGAMKTKFDVGNVLYGGVQFANPSTLSGYGVINIGYGFDIEKDLVLMPFVGIMAESYKTENIDDFDANIRTGLRAGYTYDIFGIVYKYDINLAVDTSGGLSAEGRIGAWADIDALGGDITVGVARVMDITTYKISVAAKIWF